MTASEDVTAAFGRRVRDLRTERGWSLRDMGAMVSVDAATLSRIENGAGTTIGTAGRIAALFGLPLVAMLRPVLCGHCFDAPSRGFTCQECGAAGPEVTQ